MNLKLRDKYNYLIFLDFNSFKVRLQTKISKILAQYILTSNLKLKKWAEKDLSQKIVNSAKKDWLLSSENKRLTKNEYFYQNYSQLNTVIHLSCDTND